MTFSLVYNNNPSMGIKVEGFDPALINASKEFVAIMRAVTGVSKYSGSGYYQLVMALAGNESSAAAEAGLRSGDVILSANLKPVATPAQLGDIVKNEGKKRGAVMLQVNRRGDTFFLTVDLAKKK